MIKILFLMHVDWNWIKQRPQFIAEEFSKNHSVTIVYPISKNRKKLTKNPSFGIDKIGGYLRLPHAARKIPILSKLSDCFVLAQLYFKFQISEFDVVFVTHPFLVGLIPNSFSGIVIYDCMDNHSEFEEVDKNMVYKQESDLCKRADFVLCSSSKLMEVIVEKYNVEPEKLRIVYNAISDKFTERGVLTPTFEVSRVAYLGTVSDWFDFESLLYALENNKELVVDIIGPVTIDVPHHDRLNFLGPVDHDKIANVMSRYSCLVMPFIVNDLVKSVDPVKLYEYIFLGGCIITVYYDEICRFSEFVNFYRDKEEFSQLLKYFINKEHHRLNIPDIASREKFILSNTWSSRVANIELTSSHKSCV